MPKRDDSKIYCYVCNRSIKKGTGMHIGGGIYRHKSHRVATIKRVARERRTKFLVNG